MRRIDIGFIDVNEYELESTLVVGQSVQRRIFTKTKKNQGFGQHCSDGSRFEVRNGVQDQDIVDSVCYKRGK